MKLDLKAPHTVYRDSSGKRLTGVTTILSVLSKPQLFKWYADEERRGIMSLISANAMTSPQVPIVLPDKPFAEIKRDSAADLGTVAHARIESWLTCDRLEKDGIPDDVWDATEHSLSRFVDFWVGEGMCVVETEKVMVYESAAYSFGGTADVIALDRNGRVTLMDIKTTRSSPSWPYPETYAQVAAYAETYTRLEDRPIDRIVVVRVGKDRKDEIQTVEVDAEERELGWNLFTAAYTAYECKKLLAR